MIKFAVMMIVICVNLVSFSNKLSDIVLFKMNSLYNRNLPSNIEISHRVNGKISNVNFQELNFISGYSYAYNSGIMIKPDKKADETYIDIRVDSRELSNLKLNFTLGNFSTLDDTYDVKVMVKNIEDDTFLTCCSFTYNYLNLRENEGVQISNLPLPIKAKTEFYVRIVISNKTKFNISVDQFCLGNIKITGNKI